MKYCIPICRSPHTWRVDQASYNMKYVVFIIYVYIYHI